jgi:hypothetical protein
VIISNILKNIFIVRFLRQYHEEREGKEIKVQEYFLGRFSKEKLEELLIAEKKDKVILT